MYMDPFPQGTEISQQFGANPGGVNPGGGHTGRDYKVGVGTPIRAAGDGVIAAAQYFGSDYTKNPWWYTPMGGLTIVLDCGDTAPTFGYSHCSQALVTAGQHVAKGDVIGYSGNTGTATTGPHCHVEQMLPGYLLGSNTYGRTDPEFDEYYNEEQDTTVTPEQMQELKLFIQSCVNDSIDKMWATEAVTQKLVQGVANPQAIAQALLTGGVITLAPKVVVS